MITFERISDVEEWQFKSYEEKLEVANQIIKEALSKSKRPAVAFSGGKNSLVVLHLVLKQKPDVIVAFNNTLVEYKETVKFVRWLAKEWNLNFYEIKPPKGVNFWKIVKEYGFPTIRAWHKDGVSEPACCRFLKTEPVAEFYNKKHIDCFITGISAFESRARKLGIASRGLLRGVRYVGHYGKLWNETLACHPIALWTELDIWRYIEQNSLPVNPAYEKYGLDRTGCFCCTGYLNWQKVLSRTHPNIFRKIIRMMGQSSLRDFYGGE